MTADAHKIAMEGWHGAVPSATQARARLRITLTVLVFAAIFVVLAVRVTLVSLDSDRSAAAALRAVEVPAQSGRSDIVDRNGTLLATDIAMASLYADPRAVWNAEETADAIRTVLPDLSREDLIRKLQTRSAFVWIERNLSPTQVEAVRRLGFPELDFKQEPRRHYPHRRAAAHVLGYAGIDNVGLSGVEKGLGQRLQDPARCHEPVVLSLDLGVQHVLSDELAAGMALHNAIGASGLVLNVNTGEIVAMANLPDFDPNDPTDSPGNARFNQASLGVYELGSIFKIFTLAQILDTGKAHPGTKYRVQDPLVFGRHTISDSHPEHRALTLAEVLQKSSNRGAAMMALSQGPAAQKAFLDKLGLLHRQTLELPETGTPVWPARWADVQTATISFGHGISVTPVQFASAAAAMVNGGRLIDATLLKRDPANVEVRAQVIKPQTSAQMRTLLREVVTIGTGKRADVPGYPVSGKTGSSEKIINRGYDRDSLRTSFVGYFPAEEPQYLVLVVMDEPKVNRDVGPYATAGYTAAPVVAKIVSRIGPLLKVAVTRSAMIEPDLQKPVSVPGKKKDR